MNQGGAFALPEPKPRELRPPKASVPERICRPTLATSSTSGPDLAPTTSIASKRPSFVQSINLDSLAGDAARQIVFFIDCSSERPKANVLAQGDLANQPRLSITRWRGRSTLASKSEGVGTTTCAVSYAVELAADTKVLLVGLNRGQGGIGHVLGTKVAALATQVLNIPNLTAMSLDPADCLKWQMRLWCDSSQEDGMSIEIVREIGVFAKYLETVPGADSAAAMVIAMVHCRFAKYERVVFDMDDKWATWRMAQFPIIFDLALKKLRNKIAEKQGTDDAQSSKTPTKLTRRMCQYQNEIHALKRMLKDNVTTSVVQVCLPTPRAVTNLNMALAGHQKHQIRVAHVIVNKVLNEIASGEDVAPDKWYSPAMGKLEISSTSYRSRREHKTLREIRTKFTRVHFCVVPQLDNEVSGLAGIKEFARFLLTTRKAKIALRAPSPTLGSKALLPSLARSDTVGANARHKTLQAFSETTPPSSAAELLRQQPGPPLNLRSGQTHRIRSLPSDKDTGTPSTTDETVIPSSLKGRFDMASEEQQSHLGLSSGSSIAQSGCSGSGIDRARGRSAPKRLKGSGIRRISSPPTDVVRAPRGVRFIEVTSSRSLGTTTETLQYTRRRGGTAALEGSNFVNSSIYLTSCRDGLEHSPRLPQEASTTDITLAYSQTRQHYSLHRIAKHYSKAREYGNFDALPDRMRAPVDYITATGRGSLPDVLTHAFYHFVFVVFTATIITVPHIPAKYVFLPLASLDMLKDPLALVITRAVCSSFVLPLMSFPFFSFADIDLMRDKRWILYFTLLTFLGACVKMLMDYLLFPNVNIFIFLCIQPLHIIFIPIIQAMQLEKGETLWWQIFRRKEKSFDKTTYSHIAGFVVMLSAMFCLFFYLLMDALYLSQGLIPFSTIFFWWIQLFIRPFVLFLVKRGYFLVSSYGFGLVQNPSVRYWFALWLNPLLLGLLDAKVAASCRDWQSFGAIMVGSLVTWFISVFQVVEWFDRYRLFKFWRNYLNSGETEVFPGWVLKEWRGATRLMEHVGLTVAVVVMLVSYPILTALNEGFSYKKNVMLDWWYPNGATSLLFLALLLLLEFLEDFSMRYVIKKATGRNYLGIGSGWLFHPNHRKVLIAVTITAGYAIVQLDSAGYIVHTVALRAQQDEL